MNTQTLDAPFLPVTDPDSDDRDETLVIPAKPAKKTTRKPAYDKGQAGMIEKTGCGKYRIQSFRKPETFYDVDLNERDGHGVCSCPDHQSRGRRCKHINEASLASYLSAVTKAREMTEDELFTQARRSDLRPEIRSAVVDVLSHRYL